MKYLDNIVKRLCSLFLGVTLAGSLLVSSGVPAPASEADEQVLEYGAGNLPEVGYISDSVSEGSRTDTGYAADPAGSRTESEDIYDASGIWSDTGYAADSMESQTDTGYAADSTGSQTNTGYAADSMESQTDTGYIADSMESQTDTGYAADSTGSQTGTEFTADTEENQADTGRGTDTGESQTDTGDGADAAGSLTDTGDMAETSNKQEEASEMSRKNGSEDLPEDSSADKQQRQEKKADDPAQDESSEEMEEELEAEEELEELTVSGEDVADSIHEIIEASSQLVLADQNGIERLQDYIAETEEAYKMLPQEEKEALSGSFENLSHASTAVDVMRESVEQLENTGTIVIEQSRNENSWRFIDGVPVKDALAVVEEERIEVAEASADENLLTSHQTEEAALPKGDLLGLPVPSGEQARVILVDDNSVKNGIDVSEWQYVIDWPQVKAGGIDFAIIRCGYGNDFYSQDDDYWLRNVTACEQYGIPYGVYLYSKATTAGMIDSEVAHTLRLLQGHNPQLPVYIDIEENSQILLGDAKLSKLADRYCSKIIQAGYKSGIYAGTYGWENFLTLVARNDNYFHWVAQWNPKGCSYGGRYEMWQCAVEPGVPGIDGDVDRDVWYGAFPKANAKAPVPVTPAASSPHIGYKSHVQSFGWEGSWIRDGAMSGTEGQAKRLEGIQIKVENDADLGVEYRTHVQTYGWEDAWRTDGAISGTTGESKRLEAIQIRLTGKDAEKYDIYYCVHAQHFGWLNWAKNGDAAGTAGYGYRLEGIRIRLVKKGGAAPANLGSASVSFRQAMIRYNTHVQTFGWQAYVNDGELAGTTGLSKRLEGIHIQLANQPYSGNIEYQTHVQTYGWEKNWKKNGKMSGTSGQAKRLEGIRIRLTGEMAKNFDVYYQTHIQHFGWTGWAKNGASCGSAGYAYRLEGIRILLVPKGGGAPGSTEKTFYQK